MRRSCTISFSLALVLSLGASVSGCNSTADAPEVASPSLIPSPTPSPSPPQPSPSTAQESEAPAESQQPEPQTQTLSPKDIASRFAPAVVHLLTDSSSGTGFVVDSVNGIVVTNAHVVTGAGLLKAGLSTGEQVSARILGSAPCEDLAVVQLNEVPESLVEVTLGDSSALVSQDTVTAMGYPAAFGDAETQSVVTSSGAVQSPKLSAEPASSLPRYSSLIQHDAAINPGNSGGPLFNDQGAVVGINTLANTEEGGRAIQGQYYAISMNRALQFINKLSGGESILDIGLTGAALSDVLSQTTGIPGIHSDGYSILQQLLENGVDGLIVRSVATGGPADLAKIYPNDLILSVNGVETTSFAQMCDVLASSSDNSVTVAGIYLDDAGNVEAGDPWEVNVELK